MSTSHILSGLAGYALQVAILVGACLPLPALLRIKNPDVRFTFFYGVLAVVLVLPLVPPLAIPVSSTGSLPEIAITTSLSGVVADEGFGDIVITLLTAVLGLIGLARLLRLPVGYGVLCRYRREAREVTEIPGDSEWRRLRSGVPVTIRVSERVKVPLSFGLRRPTILLPLGFPDLPEDQRHDILSHEQIHLERRDWVFVIFEECVRSLLWFHPAVQILIDRIELSREQLIDREVVRRSGERVSYLRTLYAVAKTFRQTPVAPAIPFIRPGHLKERVTQLKQEVFIMSRTRCVCLFAVLFIVLAGTALAVSSAIRFAPVPEAVGVGTSVPAAQESQEKKEEKSPEGEAVIAEEAGVKIQLVKRVNPSYPAEAKQQGITGKVILQVKIGKDGKVIETQVKESVHELLDKAAAEAVKQWEYTPPVLDGKPVEVLATVTIAFKLE